MCVHAPNVQWGMLSAEQIVSLVQLQCQIACNAPPTLPVRNVILQITSGPMKQAAAKLVVSLDARHVPALQPVRFVIQRTISFSVAEILAPSAHLVSALTVRV